MSQRGRTLIQHTLRRFLRRHRPPARRSAAALLAAALRAALCLPQAGLPLAWIWAVPPPALAAVAAFGVLAAGGCGRQVEPGRQPQLGAEAEWAWLVAAKRQLDVQRGQLAALGAPAAPPPPAAAGATGAAGGAASPRDRLAREVEVRAQQFGRRLVAYINADPPVEGTPLSVRQLAAIRMKSDEEIVVAHEFIARAGDYRRACEIYEAALAADPQNPLLHEELQRAEAARYIAAGRFAHAAPGMTAEQVREALGPPNAHDVRAYPDKGVVGWFYPKDAAGAAAAVWFEQRGGTLTAFLCDWNALPSPLAPAVPPAPPRRKPPAETTPETAPEAALDTANETETPP
ncbi:MAG: hypothetical protein JOZ15_00725 [Acidobacteria bacterium]|nr:hypothetical protein [Acidobacteriota bacterium]